MPGANGSEAAAELLELGEVAAELGVHYQTAYRWVRSGRLQALKRGRRYYVRRSTMEALAAERDELTPARPRVRNNWERTAGRVYDALMAGDEATVRRMVEAGVRDGTAPSAVIEGALVPALRRIGQGWVEGSVSISEEHRASAIVERVLGELVVSPRGRRRGTAVVAALAGDRHTLPTTMAAVALREDHWHVHHLGSDLPADELERFANGVDADLVVISVTTPGLEVEADKVRRHLEQGGRRVLVGAGGATLGQLQRMARGG